MEIQVTEIELTKAEPLTLHVDKKMAFASNLLDEDYSACCFCCRVLCPTAQCRSRQCSPCCGKSIVSDDHEQAAGIGAYLFLSVINRPKVIFNVISSIFELTFVLFSLTLSSIEFKDEKERDAFLKVGFALGLIDTFIFLGWTIRGVVLWCKKKKRKSAEIAKPEFEPEHDEHITARETKDGRVALMFLFKRFFVFMLIYPILICDLYGFVEKYVKEYKEKKDKMTSGDISKLSIAGKIIEDNKADVAVFAIGLLLTLWEVYIQRAIFIHKAASDIKKEKKRLGFNPHEKGCFKFEWRLLFHTILVMLTHLAVVASILLNACKENESSSDDEITVSKKEWFMILAGFLLPILSLVLFITSNLFWAKAYMIEILTAFGLKSKVNPSSAIGRIIASIKSKNVYDAYTSTCRRIQLPFQDWRIVIFSMIHASGVCAFAVFAYTANEYFGYVIIGAFVLTDLAVLFIAVYWLLLLSYIITLPCAYCMKFCRCENCWGLFHTQMQCYFGIIGCEQCVPSEDSGCVLPGR